MQTNIEKTIQAIRGNITQAENTTLYKGQDMGARYSLASNKPASGAGGLTDAVQKALIMDGYSTRVLIGDNYASAFNKEHELFENQICILGENYYLTKEEIKARLDNQDKDIRSAGCYSLADYEILMLTENDLTDTGRIEPNSSNWEYCRDLQRALIREFEYSLIEEE
jgi:hypothetical protein